MSDHVMIYISAHYLSSVRLRTLYLLNHAVQVRFDTLPTAVNLQWWNIRCNARAVVPSPLLHMFWVAVLLLWHTFATHINTTKFWIVWPLRFIWTIQSLHWHIRKVDKWFSPGDSASFHSHNSMLPFHAVTALELTCPLDSVHHLQSARDHKLQKEDYQLLLSVLDRLGIVSF